MDLGSSNDLIAVTKRNKAWLKMTCLWRDLNPGPPVQKFNALTAEQKSGLPDAVVRDWLYTEAMHDLLYADIRNIVEEFYYLCSEKKALNSAAGLLRS